ncbi:hypothetical protein swp_1826 [Shewanella piezotolerans WP3]|uniref:Uncharacterized protein n=1 Tax=Shewanella piezotolerans (strain WP3 / JCM 13877) TaxID=225849 RepID=B8CLD9_SHEPW|nr:hypothetical protein swp_1826 [Shewanella piezotolerans WP3]
MSDINLVSALPNCSIFGAQKRQLKLPFLLV